MKSIPCGLFGRIALVWVLFIGPLWADGPDSYRLLPDVGGPVTQAAVSVNSARHAALRNADLISHIVSGLSLSARFMILTNDRGAFTVKRNPWPERVSFLPIKSDSSITIWTQDPFLVLKSNSGKTRLLTPRQFERADDEVMPKQIAEANDFELISSKLYFEGGNIVSDEEFVFIGANTIRYNAQRWLIGENDIVRLFEQELGRKVLVVGPYPQPIGHIDMMLTPLGNGRVALADAGAGAAVVRQLLASGDADSIRAFETATEANFFGSPAIKSLALHGGGEITPPSLIEKTEAMVEASEQMAGLLDGIADALEHFGYEVVRIPFLYGGNESEDQDNDKETVSKATYPMLTYNNVLIEQSGNEQIVYLPRYGLNALDDAARAKWEQLGFTVRAIDGLTTSAMYGGALRCSVKVLSRSN